LCFDAAHLGNPEVFTPGITVMARASGKIDSLLSAPMICQDRRKKQRAKLYASPYQEPSDRTLRPHQAGMSITVPVTALMKLSPQAAWSIFRPGLPVQWQAAILSTPSCFIRSMSQEIVNSS